jgi:hypothetical protein
MQTPIKKNIQHTYCPKPNGSSKNTNIPQVNDVTVAKALLIKVSLSIAMAAKKIVTAKVKAISMIEAVKADIQYYIVRP